jgi:hypothetical protein
MTKCNHEKINRLLAMTLLLLFASPILIAAPMSNAQSAASLSTHAFLAVSPNPAGVNQDVTLMMWLIEFNPTSVGPAGGGRWENLSITITAPDSKTQTLGPFRANDAAFQVTTFKPDKLGTYSLTFNFPGQLVVGRSGFGVPINAYYQPSSFSTSLTVQQQSANALPQTPLPTGFWSRPIDAQNQEWYKIAGNWLGLGGGGIGGYGYNRTSNFNPYTQAPNSAHIIWTKPVQFGGQIGGQFGGSSTTNYYSGKSYEPAFQPPIIINGVLYYNSPAPPKEGFYAVDVRTGETLWWQNGTAGTAAISCGQVLNYNSPNQEGGIAYLWSTTGSLWRLYDAVTGNWILNIANATSGYPVEGSNGELLMYLMGTNWLAIWNSTKCIMAYSSNQWQWRLNVGATLDWNKGIQLNTTITTYPGQSINAVDSGIILATNGAGMGGSSVAWQMEIGYDANTGQQLWAQNRSIPISDFALGYMGGCQGSPATQGVYVEYSRSTTSYCGYSLRNGEKLWGPTPAIPNAWASQAYSAITGYGILYGQPVDGIHSYNLTTGQHLWDFYGDNSGVNFPGFTNYPTEATMQPLLADGKLFVATGDSHGDPEFMGIQLYAVNATTGTKIWQINGAIQSTMAVADGVLVAYNSYDNQIYAFSQGQSATSVTAPTTAVPHGTPIMLTGTVTDQSPGKTARGIPTAGTPAVSDDSMTEWMEYLYQQQPKPTNATGVTVQLTAIDPNGNWQNIGTATSDIDGTYAISWTPPVPGIYKITATFAGSNSYYASTGTTHLLVSNAPSPAAPTTQSPAPSPTSTIVPVPSTVNTATPTQMPSQAPQPASGVSMTTYVVVAAVVAIVVIATAAFVLRKRK